MIAITFDTDHMTPDGLSYFIDAVVPKSIRATFFCYRPFVCLNSTDHEVAVHPYLAESSDWISTTRELIDKVESASNRKVRGLRPHSLMSSQNYIVKLNSIGMDYVSSISAHPEMDVDVFRYPWGPAEIPIRYMDNMDLWARDKTHQTGECFSKSHIENALNSSGVYCFDFHPIHILLNTSHFSDYEEWTSRGRPELKSCVGSESYGVRSFFLDICSAIERAGDTAYLCSDIVSARTSAGK